ncbi:glycosyl hydrolase [Streptomyces sp. GTA36]
MATLACGSLLLCAAPASATEDIAGDPGSIGRAPTETAPKVRWWWPADRVEQTELDNEVAQVHAAGFRGVEQVLYNGKVPGGIEKWGTQRWTARTADTVNTATRLGLEFDTTAGPAWPMSSPAVSDPADRLSMQELHYGAIDVAGGTTFDGPVPDRDPGRPIGQRQKDLVAVTAIRVPDAAAPTVLAPSSAIDLTDSVDEGTTLRWRAPEGTWKIFGFWQRPTYQSAVSSGGSPSALVADHLSKEAAQATLTDYEKRFFGPISDEVRKNRSSDLFEDSLENAHGKIADGQSAVFWTGSFLDEFRNRRGYDLTTYLPGLFKEFSFADQGATRLKSDYDLTVDDLYIDNHIKPVAAFAAKHGMTYRAQAYGELVTDEMRMASVLPLPDVESLAFGDSSLDLESQTSKGATPGSKQARDVMDGYRQIVSGAHVSGAEEVSNEFGATLQNAYNQDGDDYKHTADRAFASGVTTPVLHGLSYQKYDDGVSPSWPGWCTWCNNAYGPYMLQISESWSPKAPQWKHWSGLNGYMSRFGAVLRDGTPRVDLTVLDADASPTNRSQTDDVPRKALTDAGFTWDAMSPTVLAQSHDVADGRLLPNGPAYKAIVVNNQKAMSSRHCRDPPHARPPGRQDHLLWCHPRPRHQLPQRHG